MKGGQACLLFVCVFVSSIIVSNSSKDQPNTVEYAASNINSFNVHTTTGTNVTPKDYKECDCGEHSTNCKFNYNGKRQCECEKGFGQKVDSNRDQTCTECDCGTNGYRCIIGLDGSKICSCRLGIYTNTFVTKNDKKCKECDCGPYGVSCTFDNNGNILCKCIEGYASEKISKNVDDEFCIPCECGEYGSCKVKNGRKVCTCEFGFAELEGKCVECDCGRETASTKCTFDTLFGYRKCDCKEGYLSKEMSNYDNEYCERCDCGEFAESCEWFLGHRKCTCKAGYVRNEDDYMGDNDYCRESSIFDNWTTPLIIMLVIAFIVALVPVILRVIRSRRNW